MSEDYNPPTTSEVPIEGRRAEGGSESHSPDGERAPGKYIYCVIQTSRFAPCCVRTVGNSFGINGENKGYNPPTTRGAQTKVWEGGGRVGVPSEARAPTNFGYIGINNREIRLISYKDIAAVVSSTPIINFDRLNKKELTTYVAIHQKVNEEVMKNYDVVPMTFGVIAPNLDEVLRILEKAYFQFKTALKNVIGKAEFVVQVWWNPQKILEELANTNLEIQKLTHSTSLRVNPEPVEGLKQEISPTGTILGMPIKLRLGKLIAQKMEQKRQTFINDIQDSFGNLSSDFTSNKLIDDKMIVNFSLLIEKAKEPGLDKKMQELGRKYEEKLRFKYIGPMPPYSFVNINLGLGNFELVNEARKLLGLGEEATFDEIKKAYYELAHKYHPDKFQGGEEQMKKLVRAYSILGNYCQSCDELSGRHPPTTQKENQSFDKPFGSELRVVEPRSRMGQKYSFREEDVKNSIMIKYA